MGNGTAEQPLGQLPTYRPHQPVLQASRQQNRGRKQPQNERQSGQKLLTQENIMKMLETHIPIQLLEQTEEPMHERMVEVQRQLFEEKLQVDSWKEAVRMREANSWRSILLSWRPYGMQ